MSLLSKFRRVHASSRCPICGKPDWCLVANDGSGVVCARTPSKRRWNDAGWFHPIGKGASGPWTRSVTIPVTQPRPEFDALARRYRAALDQASLHRLVLELGVSPDGLRRLGVGRAPSGWSFPMLDASRNVLGIRLRTMDGRKIAVRGSRDGIFIPQDLVTPDPLFIAEGPTDTAALLDLGASAIGRPSCRGGTWHVRELVRDLRPGNVVVVADRDGPGLKGAESLAVTLSLLVTNVRVLSPPDGSKDVRAWRQAGATRQDLDALVDRAEPVELQVTSRGNGR